MGEMLRREDKKPRKCRAPLSQTRSLSRKSEGWLEKRVGGGGGHNDLAQKSDDLG
jgi:hypothetical protein